MNWKHLLKLDLGALVRGQVEVAPTRERGRRRRSKTAPTQYRPGAYYRFLRWGAFGRPWPGPYYWNLRRWQRELLDTMNQLTAIVRTNANLVEGLEKAAEELSRQRFGNLFYRLQWITFLALGVVGAIATVFPGVGFDEEAIAGVAALSCAFILVALLRIAQSGSLEAVLLTLRDDLAEGLPLSHAIHRQRRIFPRFYVDMVRAGEDAGRLAQTLEELSEESIRLIGLRGYIRRQLLYLALVIAAQATILAFILTKVVPVFAEIFREFGGELPALTQLIVRIGDFFAQNALTVLPAVLGCFVLFFWIWRRHMRQWASRSFATPFMFVPAFRRLVQKQNLAGAALMLSHLLRAGVPLPQALESVATADLHRLYRSLFHRLAQRVERGTDIGEACGDERFLLPAGFRSYVSLGERSGMLPDALAHVGQYYREDTAKWSRILADTVTPVGVLCLGALTLMVLGGLYTSIWSLSDIMGQPQ
ncbi:MAG: type II secretion system F family protein [Candidatus Hydrogenedentes bacterium]|nr:type II secretion system F family protein [Candidatus Hydrogenedentota bacterium]